MELGSADGISDLPEGERRYQGDRGTFGTRAHGVLEGGVPVGVFAVHNFVKIFAALRKLERNFSDEFLG
jgi:hypothetical protein